MSISPNRLKELENIPDPAIDTSDIPELMYAFPGGSPGTSKALSS